MTQRIILIHGRSTKPAQKPFAELQQKALLQGLQRVSPAKAQKLREGKVKIDIVYYGDVNNEILSKTSKSHANSLTATDKENGNALCLPDVGYAEAIEALNAFKTFSKGDYKLVLKRNGDLRWIDDAARAVSTLAAISSATLLNNFAIKLATADMGAYLMRRKYGSEIRQRLQQPLKDALINDDDIFLVSHSMGCIVAYDVLWKFSRMSEYAGVRAGGAKVKNWMTLGCPLGEAGVKANLVDGPERDFVGGSDRYPKNIVENWLNFAAYDDFISHDATMRDDYKAMRKYGYIDEIKDRRMYNCYSISGKANPHKIYGYLAHPGVVAPIADWIK